MKVGDKVWSVEGGRKRICPCGCRTVWNEGGPFAGEVVRLLPSNKCLIDDPWKCSAIRQLEAINLCSTCRAVILKADGRDVTCRVANLRPYGNGAAFRKARREWER